MSTMIRMICALLFLGSTGGLVSLQGAAPGKAGKGPETAGLQSGVSKKPTATIAPGVHESSPIAAGRRSSQTATGADVVVLPGTHLVLSPGTVLSLGGDFSNGGVVAAGHSSTVSFDGTALQSLRGPFVFDNLEKSGGGSLHLASSVTVNDSLTVLAGDVTTDSESVTFSANGNLNGGPVGGEVIGPGIVIVPGYSLSKTLMANGWNLLGLELTVPDAHKGAVYPTSVSHAFIYQGMYKPQDSLSPGIGFWLKFSGAQTNKIAGIRFTNDTIDVARGWNMVGCLSSPILTTSIVPAGTTITSNFFGYSGAYVIADTISPGRGYWVKVNGPGKLILAGSRNVPASSVVSELRKWLLRMNRIMVEDAGGAKQDVYFARQPDSPLPDEYLAAPPPAPASMFDVRFGSQRIAEVADGISAKKVLLKISGARFPLKISWVIVDAAPGARLVVNGKGIPMDKDGSVSISKEDSRIFLEMNNRVDVPTSFSLEQNYPNPFNPTTRISYSLQADSRVSLKIFNNLGQQVMTVVDGFQPAGNRTIDVNASGLPSGVYYYRLEAGSFRGIKKMVLIR